MLGLFINPYVFPTDAANNPRSAYRALADAAKHYLAALDASVADGLLPQRVALNTRIRGTGPGVAFGDLIRQLEELKPTWQCPFEGSRSVSGAELPAAAILHEPRDDGFLLLQFQEQTLDLPLHVHDDSDRFICVIGGRGFFHVTSEPTELLQHSSIRHVPARDRDALMFRRGTAHTFSTDRHPLYLLSYHRPFVPISSQTQYRATSPPSCAADFLVGIHGKCSFDAAWNPMRQQLASRLSRGTGTMLPRASATPQPASDRTGQNRATPATAPL